MIVTVTPEDYRPYHVEVTPDVLDGVAFQRALEHAAWEAGKGKVPLSFLVNSCEREFRAALGKKDNSFHLRKMDFCQGAGSSSDVYRRLPCGRHSCI